MRAEGFSRLTYELEQQGESVKLTVIHEIDKPDSKLIEAVSNGWPHLLSSLKSLLETGESLVEPSQRGPKTEPKMEDFGDSESWTLMKETPMAARDSST